LLRQLQGTAPQLKRFFADLGPFSEASRPSFRSLGKAAVIGNKAFKDSKAHIAELKALSEHAPSTGKNLRQFLQTLDDRNRSTQGDPRAKDSAPPAPDPTAYHDGQGFTGMEALLNYPYWQSLALNAFDQMGHLLRVVLNINSCSAWQTGPVDDSNKTLFKNCNSWLGPVQPGVTAPDPTKGTYTYPDSSGHGVPVSRKGLTPEATNPLPGQNDPSVPHVVLPPAIQQLLKELPLLGGGGAIGVPQVDPATGAPLDNRSADKLLDFLLAP
jgi:hypothetical protein